MLKALYFYIMEHMFGVHICSEFTQWKVTSYIKHRSPTEREIEKQGLVDGHMIIVGQRRWMFRCCTICGRIQEEDLPWVFPEFDETKTDLHV